MKRLFAAPVAVVLAVAVLAAPAAALTPNQRIAKLEKRVTTLEKQNKTLKKQAADAMDVGVAALAFSVCSTAITADALQATWTVLNQVPGHSSIGTGSAVGDAAVCSRLQVSRPAAVPPTISPFEQLMRLVNTPSAVFANVFS